MNMRMLLKSVVITIAACRSVIGASVVWNGFQMADMSGFTSTSSYLIGYDGSGGSFYAYLFLSVEGSGNIKTLAGASSFTGFSGKWMTADAGTILDALTFGNCDNPLVETRLTTTTGTPCQTEVPGNFFLAVQVEKLTDEDVGFDDPRKYSGEYLYGWVSLDVDKEGNLTLTGSAIDLDGGPMVVGGGAWEGGIPEPFGGILFLLGTAVLGLRRRTNRRIMYMAF